VCPANPRKEKKIEGRRLKAAVGVGEQEASRKKGKKVKRGKNRTPAKKREKWRAAYRQCLWDMENGPLFSRGKKGRKWEKTIYGSLGGGEKEGELSVDAGLGESTVVRRGRREKKEKNDRCTKGNA